MDWEKQYEIVIETICKKSINENDTIYEIDPPEIFFNGKTYESKESGLIKKRLFKEIATEEDYKEFCEYAYQKVGIDIDTEQKSFKTFAKPHNIK